MTGMLDSVRDYAQNHPMSMVAGLVVALPGAYLFIVGKSIPCTLAGLCNDGPSPWHPPSTEMTDPSLYHSLHPAESGFGFPVSTWHNKPARIVVVQLIESVHTSLSSFLAESRQRLEPGIRAMSHLFEADWLSHSPIWRIIFVAINAALPGAFSIFIRKYPASWAARHQTEIANTLHFLAVVMITIHGISVRDVLVTTLIIFLVEVFQRSFTHERAKRVGKTTAIEPLLSSVHSVPPEAIIAVQATDINDWEDSANISHDFAVENAKGEELRRLQNALLEVKTAEQTKERELKRTQVELRNARETLAETFSEYSTLRDEVKTIKQTIGRDHQAVIYRKDIELFALRKANEQKDIYVKEKDTKMEDVCRQHIAALALRERQMQTLQDQITHYERMMPQIRDQAKVEVDGEHQAAVKVKLLRIKGRNSHEHSRLIEDKDLEIARLMEDLAAIQDGSKTLTRVQEELRRAWNATKEAQGALKEEQTLHGQTRHKLQEAAVRLEEHMKKSQANSPARLPAIEESDKHELEAMFNAAQEDNLRLYSEHEALEKRLREANERVFTSESNSEILREQLQVEKAINMDMETARPSLVHRVHYQRMEGQLKESRDTLATKDDEIECLKKDALVKESCLDKLQKEKEIMEHSQNHLQEQVSQLQKSVAELEATKEQLMLDHERLAQHRARQRNSSGDHTSARSSGATLITDSSIQAIMDDTPLPVRPATVAADRSIEDTSSIQGTPKHLFRSDAPTIGEHDQAGFSLISNDIPPPELRETKRKSLTLKSLVKRIKGKDEAKSMKNKETKESMNEQRPRTALAPKNKNAPIRPKTAVMMEKAIKKEGSRQDTAAPATRNGVERPKTPAPTHSKELAARPTTSRYYSAESRPKTALEEKEERDYASLSPRPKSRGWTSASGSRKLVRKSIV